ncbi:unnamed protein product [Protopolystoma xenopodis]|uniref:LIM zinc-binding domain-containing protein n=1 Tax=Protopolystoma xenopodis TaxID=117903 RepID=A0A448XGD6_9PLAT|nr:unnamed protein product [Protopolystoma xenopodis]
MRISLSYALFYSITKSCLCRNCHPRLIQTPNVRYICQTCHDPVEVGQQLRINGDFHHAYHFRCTECSSELGPEARSREGELYCLRCFDKMGMPICSACRRPIEGRIVRALGKAWHVEHFVCHQCEIAFMGSRYYEWRGQAYCLLHYQEKSGGICHICQHPVLGAILARFTNKTYCQEHFRCSMCNTLLDEKSKLYEVDLKPVCKECYDHLPLKWKRRLAKLHLEEVKKWPD